MAPQADGLTSLSDFLMLSSLLQDVKKHDDPELLVLPTDEALFADDGFRWVQRACSLLYLVGAIPVRSANTTRLTYYELMVCRPHAEKYAADQDAFFADYVKAHLKLSELGAEWAPEPISM